MTQKEESALIESLNRLGEESIKSVYNNIDLILDKYDSSIKQKKNLTYLSTVLEIEKKILQQARFFLSLKNRKEKERILKEIEDLLSEKQNICKKILISLK